MSWGWAVAEECVMRWNLLIDWLIDVRENIVSEMEMEVKEECVWIMASGWGCGGTRRWFSCFWQ
jgi:hypothetical protein